MREIIIQPIFHLFPDSLNCPIADSINLMINLKKKDN